MGTLWIHLMRSIGVIMIFCGTFFFVAATVGIIRMPDPYNRGHVSCKGDSPGFMLCLLGIWCYWATVCFSESLILLVIVAFMLFANPISTHSILRLCYYRRVEFSSDTSLQEEK